MSTPVSQRDIVILAAFLHDIGKAIQRGSPAPGKHPEVGRAFLMHDDLQESWTEILGSADNTALLMHLVQKHHEGVSFPADQNVHSLQKGLMRSLALIVSRADNYSSSERGVKDGEVSKRMHSVFQRLNLGSNETEMDHVYQYQPMELRRKSIFPAVPSSVSGSIDTLIEDGFIKDFTTLIQQKLSFPALVSSLDILAYNYLWCIPANTQEPQPDVSLYDHMRSSAAIAACIYDYHAVTTKSVEDIDDINDSDEKFRVLICDLAGIQSYIYDMHKTKSMARRLRARSFYVQILLEDIATSVMSDLNLPAWNSILNGGGKFYLLVPNTPEIESYYASLQERIDTSSLQRFNGELRLHLALSRPFAGNDFKKFGSIIAHANEVLAETKLHPLGLHHGKEPIIPVSYDGKAVCSYCRKYPAVGLDDMDNEKDAICFKCQQDISIGKKLANQTTLFVTIGKDEDYESLNSRFSIARQAPDTIAESTKLLVLNPKLADLSSRSLKYPFSLRFVSNYIPYEVKQPVDFQMIASRSSGNQMLGVLKADVDDLGLLAATGLKQEDTKSMQFDSISRIATLSRSMDLFFSGYLNAYISEHYPNLYVTYAGGDDLLIIGPWDSVIDAARDIESEFTEYTANPAVHLSAGISFCKPKYPIGKAIEQADNLLSKAKESEGKSAVALFDTVISWRSLDTLWESSIKPLTGWLAGERDSMTVSKQFVRNLLDFGVMHEQVERGDVSKLVWQPMLAYQIGRNLASKAPEIREWAEGLLNTAPQTDAKTDVFALTRQYLKLIATYALYYNRSLD